MGACISGLVTTRGVVARQPRPLVALGLGLAVPGRPQPLAAFVFGLALECRPQVDVLASAALVLGVVVAADSVSCPLFAYPFAAGPPPSPTTLFRMRRTWLCSRVPTGSIFNNAKWLST